MEKPSKLKILFLADYTAVDFSPFCHVILDHIKAFNKYSQHDWHLVNPLAIRSPDSLNFAEFDAIAIHYSICILFDSYLSQDWRNAISSFKKLKIQFIQDEYRWVRKISECMLSLGIDLLFTLVKQDLTEKAYPISGMAAIKKVSVLPGYIPNYLIQRPKPPIRSRSLHISYRGRTLPYWMGNLAQEKSTIAEDFLKIAPMYDVVFDIGCKEEDRVYGESWLELISSSKAVLGTESGASIWDFDGEIEKKTKQYLIEYPEATFNDVFQALLKPYEGNFLYNTISPRMFEAISLKTALVLFPGWYSGILKSHQHYILLEKDYSNFDEVSKKLKDDIYLQELVDRTYAEIIEPGLYSEQSFVTLVDSEIHKASVLGH